MFATDNISTPIAFNANVADDVALSEGDEATHRVASAVRGNPLAASRQADLINHLKVARALMVGQRIAASEAGTNQGKPYNMAFSRWLDQHPLAP